MAFAKKGSFTFNHVDQQDKLYLGNTSPTIKQKFDSRSQEMRDFVNALIDALAATTEGNSGADNIGVTPIAGVTGDTTQAVLENLKLIIDNTTAGQVPDYSITLQKMRNFKKVVDAASKNAQGYYSTVRFRRPEDDTLAVDMIGTNANANGFYETDTWRFYDATGNTVEHAITWTVSYDIDGNVLVATPA